jgi:ribulose-phosphate 3-epimerase
MRPWKGSYRIDQVLVMTVYPGFSGQRLMENVIPKIYKLAEKREKLGLGFVITADGGQIGRIFIK